MFTAHLSGLALLGYFAHFDPFSDVWYGYLAGSAALLVYTLDACELEGNGSMGVLVGWFAFAWVFARVAEYKVYGRSGVAFWPPYPSRVIQTLLMISTVALSFWVATWDTQAKYRPAGHAVWHTGVFLAGYLVLSADKTLPEGQMENHGPQSAFFSGGSRRRK